MKKGYILIRFIVDTDNDLPVLDKFEGEFKLLDNDRFKVIQSSPGNDFDLLKLARSILNNWNESSRKIILTTNQFRQLKEFVQTLR